VIVGSSYFVTVTTPGGTSAFSAVFTYKSDPASRRGTLGRRDGWFGHRPQHRDHRRNWFLVHQQLNSTLVYFCPTGGGACIASPSNVMSGGVVTTNGSPYQSLTALSPTVGPRAVQGTYEIQVEVNGQRSNLTSQAAAGSGFSPRSSLQRAGANRDRRDAYSPGNGGRRRLHHDQRL